SQVGAQLLYERLPEGGKGDVNVFRYFLFLAGTLFAVGVVGTFGLRIVNEEALINHGVEELERSGLLEESEFFRNSRASRYGTIDPSNDEDDEDDEDDLSENELDMSESQFLKRQEEEERLRRKKLWLLNHATHSFLSDRTMWLLAAGFFLLTGPGEAYINNLGTIIPSLTPSHYFNVSNPPAGHASTHVSIIALTSTFARLFTGSLSDLFAPPSNPTNPPSTRITEPEGNHVGELARLAVAADRDGGLRRSGDLLHAPAGTLCRGAVEFVDPLRVDAARRDRVHGDVVRGDLRRQCLGPADDGQAECIGQAEIGDRLQDAGGDDVDDPAPL
ncbi:MAG: putative monocarboxylate transporter mch1, partial [Watsoniomyces obsoletus]